MTESRNRTLRSLWGSLALVALLAATGCSGGAESAPASGEDVVVATVPVGELAGVDGNLHVGDEIRVMIDTPGIEWTAVSDAPEVAEVVDEDPEAAPRMVRIVATGEGETAVEFTGDGDDTQDSIAIVVGEEQ
ncbi:hypothetical protein [Microbacterium sp.]|uniref:hypothetical protein n=1 Tax=Microbacterium sp. TaxID=51671 RepID=UPI003F9EB984